MFISHTNFMIFFRNTRETNEPNFGMLSKLTFEVITIKKQVMVVIPTTKRCVIFDTDFDWYNVAVYLLRRCPTICTIYCMWLRLDNR